MKKLILPLRNRVKQLKYPFKLMLTQKIEATQNRFTSWRHKNDLFFSIITWVLVATAAYTLLNWLWGDRGIFSGWSLEENTSTPLERIKVSLTILGGIGGIGYLVIKFRERSALERSEADEKLVRAVQQLGDASPQVRIAGVYALADVADTYEGPYHQRVVDILCGYLRNDRLLKDANGDTRYATNEDGTPNHERPLSADGAVESTILTVLASHLRSTNKVDINEKTDPGPWSYCNLDLHGTTLTEALNFFRAHIGRLDAQNAHFFGRTNFHQATFTEDAAFIGATFEQEARFDSAKFRHNSYFGKATFKQTPQFTGVTFEQDTHFEQSVFKDAANFWNSTFKGISCFAYATFIGKVFFTSSTFAQYATFNYVTFAHDAHYEGVDFRQQVSFLKSTFNSNMSDIYKLFHPNGYLLEEDGLPEGAEWADFGDDSFPLRRHGKRSINEHSQPDEVSPGNDLPQDKGGEEDGDDYV
jgi:hypothetical protein